MLKMQVIGHLGKDAEVSNYDGKNVINFNVAHTSKFNGQDKTSWVQCSYWTDKTGIAPYLKKGTQIYAEGIPEVRTYSKNDGSMGVNLTLRVGSIQLLGSAQGQQQEQQPRQQHASAPADKWGPTDRIEDLPF